MTVCHARVELEELQLTAAGGHDGLTAGNKLNLQLVARTLALQTLSTFYTNILRQIKA